MEYYGAVNDYRGYLMHYGVKGMHWGVRRYQNTDGSLTSIGRQHYGYSSNRRGEGGMIDDIKRGGRKAFDYAKKTSRSFYTGSYSGSCSYRKRGAFYQ